MNFEQLFRPIPPEEICGNDSIFTLAGKDFYSQKDKDAINEAYNESNVYRKYVFGEITSVWVKNKGF